MTSTEVSVIDKSLEFRTTTFEAEKAGLLKRKSSVASIVRELGTKISTRKLYFLTFFTRTEFQAFSEMSMPTFAMQ